MIFLNPIVFHCLPGSQSFIRVQLEESKQQITALLAQSLGEGEWAKVVVMAGLAKRRFDGEHLVHENADTPAVDFVVVVGPLCDFGGDVVEGAAEGSSLTVSLDGPSEIGDFEMVVEADHVFWFQVAMNYAVSMKVLNSRQNLIDIVRGFFLREGAFPQDLLVEVAEAEFHNEEDLLPADVIPVGRQNVWVAAVEVDLHFVDEVVQLYLVFPEGLDGYEHAVDIGYCKDDVPSLALAQVPQHLEFVPGPLVSFEFSHLFEGPIHVFQFSWNFRLFLEVFAGYLYGIFSGQSRELLLYLFDIATCVVVAGQHLGVESLSVSSFGRWLHFVPGAFGCEPEVYKFTGGGSDILLGTLLFVGFNSADVGQLQSLMFAGELFRLASINVLAQGDIASGLDRFRCFLLRFLLGAAEVGYFNLKPAWWVSGGADLGGLHYSGLQVYQQQHQ